MLCGGRGEDEKANRSLNSGPRRDGSVTDGAHCENGDFRPHFPSCGNFRDAKTEVDMADYQTRDWRAWQHHMALVMLALLFFM